MKNTLENLKNQFEFKQELLVTARKTLKEEFIGIDQPIDEIINNMSSWFTLSEIQERPLIINLWGLTGVGKTSLLERLVQLINYQKDYFRVDMGQKEGKYSLKETISKLCENEENEPVIIALDEFQHTKTKDEFLGGDLEDKNRILWELIDSGRIVKNIYGVDLWDLRETIMQLQHLLYAGIVVKKGIVVKGLELFQKEMNEYRRDATDHFIPENSYDQIINLAGHQLKLNLRDDVSKIVKKFNGKESIQFLKEVFSIAKNPIEKNFSKSLIFILGNLDKAYTMSHNLNRDISADDFHKMSLEITVSKIKKALQNNFRDEQIARLGNMHVIYPAFNKNSYETIIKKELDKISANMLQLTEIEIVFDASIVDILYREGVYPTLGVRPVFTTINHLIKSNLTLLISEIFKKNIPSNKLVVSFENSQLNCDYYQEETKLESLSFKVLLNNKKKLNKKDDMQSIVAVHESGHAILSAILMKTIPKYVYSSSQEDDEEGFVFTKFSWKYIAKNEILSRVAFYLGGLAAEELIFGESNSTTGASGDIQKATNFVLDMLKSQGFGEEKISFKPVSVQTNLYIHSFETIENEAKKIMKEGFELAKTTLQKESVLLIELSNYLSDHRYIDAAKIKEFIHNYAVSQVEFIENGDYIFYRNHLKKLHSKNKKNQLHEVFPTICVNKKI